MPKNKEEILCINISNSKKKKRNIPNTSELTPENFDFRISFTCRISGASMEKIDDIQIMGLYQCFLTDFYTYLLYCCKSQFLDMKPIYHLFSSRNTKAAFYIGRHVQCYLTNLKAITTRKE